MANQKKQQKKAEKKPGTLALFLKGYKEANRLLPSLLPTTLANSLVAPILPFINIYFSARIIEELSGGKEIKKLAVMVITALCLNFICFMVTQLLSRKSQQLNSLLYNQERNEVSRVLYSTDYEKLEDADFQDAVKQHDECGKHTGSFLYRLMWMIGDQVKGFVTLVIAIAMIWPLLKVGFTTTGDSFFETPWFLITLLAFIAVAMVMILLLSRVLSREWFQLNDAFMTSYKTFNFYYDMINNYKTGKEIRIYNEQKMIEKDATQRLLTTGMKLNQRMAANSAKSSSLVAIIGAVLGFGVYLFIGIKGLLGLFSIGMLVQYAGSFMQVIGGVTLIANTTGQTEQIIPALNYYFNIIETKSTRHKGQKPVPQNVPYTIEFRDVSFKYPASETWALRHFSIKLDQSSRLAVVGRNGSGKTTFIKLLCRMYDPTEGEILLNGVNIKEYDELEYARLFSVVFQDFSIFSIRAGENIACVPSYDAQRVWDCLEKSGAARRARTLPEGLDTYLYKDLEEKGVEISGGEAQKMALSRALYKDAPFVVLDEPTAALDPIAEFDIYARFNSFVAEKAAIYISHRLSSCRFCTTIAVFDRGRLVQLGTHDELIQETDQKYYELWMAQAQYYTA